VTNIGAYVAAALVAAAALANCAGAPPKPAQVAGTIQASAQLNPSASQRPSPLLLRVYELKTAAAFNGADFMALYQRDQAELGAELLAKEEFMLSPGESRPYAKTLSPDTRFIGVIAAFRDLEHARWRALVPIQPGQKHKVEIRAAERSIDMAATR
jgi:type VI secretion system protein VasD